jgi:hypothetical protein
VEDLPTTNAYLDDHATRAAPFTIASQFITLGSDDEGDDKSNDEQDEGDIGGRTAEMNESVEPIDTAVGVNPVLAPVSKTSKRPLGLIRQMQDLGERISEKIHSRDFAWRRSSLGESRTVCADKTDSVLASSGHSRPPFMTTPLTPDGIPRPKFSIRSPSSPARFCFTDLEIERTPTINVELQPHEEDNNGISPVPPLAGIEPGISASIPAPLAVQEDDNSNASASAMSNRDPELLRVARLYYRI